MPSNPVMVNRRRRELDGSTVLAHYLWCPGCDDLHGPVSRLPQTLPAFEPTWDWDGNTEAPTFSPSLLVHYGEEGTPGYHACHSYIRGGRWDFLGDSWHPLAGQTVPLIPVPDWLLRD